MENLKEFEFRPTNKTLVKSQFFNTALKKVTVSDNISVIDVLEVFQKADELGLKAVAFTNAGNVLDFPLISIN